MNTHANGPSTWLHLGAGSFHRAHQAWYLHRLRETGDQTWTLALGNIREDMSPLLAALERQKGEYTLETITPEGVHQYETVRSISKIVPWDAQLAAVVEAGAAAQTRVISFTVTEAGYYLDQHFKLDVANADLAADLKGEKRTIYGALHAILSARRAAGHGPVTLLNCDNLRHNGERFRDGMLQFLALCGETELAAWVTVNTASPNCMVDRITPRPVPAVRERVKAATGIDDEVPVMGESFIQWVVEDRFIAGRPALENVGVEMVESVLPYEEAKIRILNASHSCIAWAGTLIGLTYIHEGTHVPSIRQMAYAYVTEDVIPSLSPSPIDLGKYRDVVLDRFGNPAIRDSNQRVAADGFSKIPGFIAPTLNECFKRGAVPVATAMLPALFYVFLQRWADRKLPYEYQDGILDANATRAMLADADPVARFCADPMLWGAIAGKPEFVVLMRESVERVNGWLAAQ
ncbi:D-arabinitol 4-dehydrogenase [Silvimonas amylolytica]|uniref:D-arabinitol 4-dehydrogenase n=1 Tax=Silvimonas amylolytica TaxID=449663 RepID=A0ABQ2PG67_9NEIS|nr:D-arabinitol 4-dehydrogenase [Silvimonas amylolytica]GGP24250.1 D-arabinitol 4-dehydrogenase [Silvimonas amylolytica]